MKDQIAKCEIAGHENAGHEIAFTEKTIYFLKNVQIKVLIYICAFSYTVSFTF